MRIYSVPKDVEADLHERRGEIEQAAMARVCAVADPTETADPEYLEGLRAAVTAAIGYGIESIERGDDRPAPIPATLISQARLAARNRVKLETVLRRYLAGYTLLGDFLVESTITGQVADGDALKRLMHLHGRALDQLLAAVAREYGAESARIHRSSGERRLQQVERLLAGELLDTADLGYDMDGSHLGLIAFGFEPENALAALVEPLDCRRLIVARDPQTAWAWLGSRRTIDPAAIAARVPETLPQRVSVAVGEPGTGLSGWRLTHQQARAVLPIAQASDSKMSRYVDLALLASIRQDTVLAISLRQLYLEPLSGGDGGDVLRETLRAYFATGRNVSSAAAILGVSRRTVTNRLRATEDRLGRNFERCAVDLQMALELEELPAFDIVKSADPLS